MSFLNKRKVEGDRRNDFMISRHASHVSELGFEIVTPGPSLKRYRLFYGASSVVFYLAAKCFAQLSISGTCLKNTFILSSLSF